MGVVYEVLHTHTGQHLALKVLTEQLGASAERFKREARVASSIQSDHIVRVTDADIAPELNGSPFLVMELLEGGDLERVTGDKPANPSDVILWLRQVARALDKAHAAGIVHRDLKPANLFLTQREDGSPLVKILDFGVAKMASESTALTRSDSFLGTPGYMAPEQTDSRGPPVTFRADLYALGLIAFKLLTGHSYWRSGSLAQLLAQILVEGMPPPSQRGSVRGPAFDAWFLRACDRDADKRFASAREQVEALAVALGLPEQPRIWESGSRPLVPSSATLDSPETFNASSTDVKADKKRIVVSRRRLAGGLAGAVVALGVAAAFVQGLGRGKATEVGAPVSDTGLPAANASLAMVPSSAPTPSPTPAEPTPAERAIDAAPPSSSSAPPSVIPTAAGSGAKHKPASPAVAPPAAPSGKGSPLQPRGDDIWRER
jgi:serine/threonine-protein kinase